MHNMRNGWHIGVNNPADYKVITQQGYIEMTDNARKHLTKALVNGVTKGYIAGPFTLDFKFPFPNLHINQP